MRVQWLSETTLVVVRLEIAMPRFLLLALPFALAACTPENEIKGEGTDNPDVQNGDQPDIELNPTSVDFGTLEVNPDAPLETTEIVQVKNVGTADLRVASLELADGNIAYTVATLSSYLIPPDGTAEFAVTFSPVTAFTASDTVIVTSNDPDEATAGVELTGEGIAPVIEVTPLEYTFGEQYIGCLFAEQVKIKNVGNADLTVTGLNFVSASTDLLLDDRTVATEEDPGNGALPWTLGQDEETYVNVYYGPLDLLPDEAYLYVASNDPFTSEVIAYQEGGGSLAGENLDEFEQPIQVPTDIVFAVDKSGSMYDNYSNVISNFGTFVESLSSLEADYHIAAVVLDDGCVLTAPYIDNSFSAAEAKDTIEAMIGDTSVYGSNTERGFTVLEAFLSETEAGGCNNDFLRDDAQLNLVGVSDEPEQSSKSWDSYVSAFQNYKEDPEKVVFHAIGGDVPGGCLGGDGSSAEPYTGYFDAVEATGGIFLSICDADWGEYLEALAEASTGSGNTFTLSMTPVPDTIEVRVDGIEVTEGWMYIAESNAVYFYESYVPEGGSTIDISYALYGECSG